MRPRQVLTIVLCLSLTSLGCNQQRKTPTTATSDPHSAKLAAGTDTSARMDTRSVTGCAAISSLRDLNSTLAVFSNARTGDKLDYSIIGDGANSDHVIVMFPGTGEILPDWPLQMITNSQYSPRIKETLAYQAAEDGPISLCHAYRLLLFDYPGVGDGKLNGSSTLDHIASDVDAMLDDAAQRYGISTDHVDLLGWSLGTAAALKYAVLQSRSHAKRQVENLLLIASKPGGNTDRFFNGNEAQCISTMMGALKKLPPGKRLLKTRLESLAFELTFPYRGQKPYDGTDSGCRATVDDTRDRVVLSVKTTCDTNRECRDTVAEQLLNRKVPPWSQTKGISDELYIQQRELAFDYSLCYCANAVPGFQSSDCHCSLPAEMSESNGGVCQTVSKPPNKPVSTNCVPLKMSGRMTVINGPEDLFIQHVYGKALVDAYNRQYGAGTANLETYSGADGAGHGVLLQHPKWTQQQLWNALNPR